MRYKCFPLCAKVAVLPPAETDKIVQCTTECTPFTTSREGMFLFIGAEGKMCKSENAEVLQYM